MSPNNFVSLCDSFIIFLEKKILWGHIFANMISRYFCSKLLRHRIIGITIKIFNIIKSNEIFNEIIKENLKIMNFSNKNIQKLRGFK